mgnify:CR=1 FL=1
MANDIGKIVLYLQKTTNQGETSSYIDINVVSTTNPYLSLGTLDAWCIDTSIGIDAYLVNYPGTLYSTSEYKTWDSSLFPTIGNKDNLDLVNWLIDQNFSTVGNANGYTYADVQAAIWTLLGQSAWDPHVTYNQGRITQLVNLASAHDGFKPDITDASTLNDDLALAVDLTTADGKKHQQPLIIKIKSAALGDYVWEDTDADGIQDDTEHGIKDVTVKLVRDINNDNDFDDANEVLQTTTTGPNGEYKFVGLTPGSEYQVVFSTPNGFDNASPRHAGSDTAKDSDGAVSDKIVLGAGEWNKTIDAGFYKLASLGDRLWEDKNANGLQDDDTASATSGLENYTVTLIGGGADKVINGIGDTSATTVTGADGFYEFTGLTPGVEYQVQFNDLPAGYQFTSQDAGDDTLDSDANASDGKTQIVTLTSGEHNPTLDAGVYQTASLGDRLWEDKNANGLQDDDTASATSGLENYTVTLIGGGDDKVIGTADDTSTPTLTGVDGFYEFTGLTPGVEYQVEFDLPAGYQFTSQDAGDDTLDSDVDVGTGKTQIVTLSSGEHNPTLDAGVYQTASLGDRLWEDKNANGLQDDGATGLEGRTVTLIGGGADKVINGIGDTSATTVTGADGFYEFTGLTPGVEYQVQFTDIPSDYQFTSQDAGDDSLDSDANVSDGKTQIVTLSSGEHNPTLDAGVYQTAELGDKIWYDKDTDGVQDANETGISGLTVNLMGAGTNNIFGDSDDVILATDTTDGNGNYLFTGLEPGDYQVQFSKPTGYVYTQANQGGDDAKDSDAVVATGRSGTVNLESGESDLTVDAGAYKVGIDVEKYVSGTVCTTVNSCGGEGESSTYWKNNYCYSSSGSYWSGTGCKLSDNFNSVFGTNCSGGNKSLYQVLCTTGGGQDALLRECVAAYLNACHSKVSYAYTKEQVCAQTKYALSCGNYTDTYNSFCKENSTGCDWGSSKETYNCTVDTTLYDADAPPGLQVKVGSTVTFTYIVKNTGDSALKDVKLVDDRIATVTYVSGDTNNNGWLDIGESWKYTAKETASSGTIKNTGTVTGTDAVGGTEKVTDKDDAYYTGFTTTTKGAIGDKVWLDKDNDGIQESGEYGVGGVKVTLKGAGVDGVFGTSDDITATTTTNSKGNYIFNNLDAGKYQVVVNGVSGYAFTKQNQGSNDAADSDVDSSGASHIVTLATGQQDLTVDAGIFCAKASVGNKVWDDMNHNYLQDSSEPGIGGITVTLYKADNTFVASMKTDDWGNYQFSNLDPGSYYLQFDKTNVWHYNYNQWNNMSNWKWAPKDVGSNDAIDSDVAGNGISTTNVTKTDVFTLVAGQNDTTRDAGITPLVIDLNGDGVQTVARSASIGSFDLLGNGSKISSGWLSGSDGFLAVDSNSNGSIDSINELFGGLNKGDGFAKLANYDSNSDGVVNASDAEFASLKIWQDANGNHATDAGELISLADAGIVSLNVSFIEVPEIDAQGNLHLERSSVVMANGSARDMTDVYFNVSADDVAAQGVQLPSLASLASDPVWLS